MPTVALAKILNDAGTNSVKELFLKTGVQDNSLLKQAQIAAINQFYRKNGSFRSPYGFPISEVKFNNLSASRDFAGGSIHFTGNGPQGGEEFTCVRVRFIGFHCLKESSEWSSSDEPYFLIGVAGSNGSRLVRFGPYGDVDKGNSRYEAADIVSENEKITPPIILGIVAMEHDEGSSEEAENKVRKIFEDIEDKFESAVGTFSGVDSGNHVLPEWARTILIGWIPEGVAAVLGLGDDLIDKVPKVFFDYKAGLDKWIASPVLGKHGENEYNEVLTLNGGKNGKYHCYFNISLFTYTNIKPQ